MALLREQAAALVEGKKVAAEAKARAMQLQTDLGGIKREIRSHALESVPCKRCVRKKLSMFWLWLIATAGSRTQDVVKKR